MKVAVDREKCVGAGQCVIVAPEVFDQSDDDGIVILLEDAPEPAFEDAVRSAAQICPALAIELSNA